MRTVHLAVYDTLSDWEPGHLISEINAGQWGRDHQWQVRTVGETREPVTTMGGITIVPDLSLDDVDPRDSGSTEMLVLSGSGRWDQGLDAAFADKARDFLAAGVPVAAICGATYGLATAGLLDGRAHTSNAREYLASSGYAGGDRYVDEAAVTDGDLVTGSGVQPVAFAAHALRRLGVYRDDVLTAWQGLYETGESRYFYDLMAAAG